MKSNQCQYTGRFIAACMILVLLISGCALPTNAPLKNLYYPHPDHGPEGLIVFLQGRGGSNTDFAANGFVDAVNSRRLPFDIMAPDAHMGYYMAETLVSRLKNDVIEPAKTDGYRRIWLVGVSMGGLGALMYFREHPEDIAGVFLISPFLGYSRMISEISAAGGVSAWQPGPFDPKKDWERMLWAWLKDSASSGKLTIPIYLGYGEQDGFLSAHQLFAQILPDDHVRRVSGGHDTETMLELWHLFLDSSVFTRSWP